MSAPSATSDALFPPPPADLETDPSVCPPHSPREELANVVTHGLGLVLAVAGTIAGCVVAAGTGSPLRIATVAVFGVALILCYLSSTGFHLSRDARRRLRWRLFDHASIYVLIAGTYTPVVLVGLGGAWGWSLFAIVWAMALAGVASKTVLVGRYDAFERIDTLLYLAMGWLGVVAIVPIWTNFSGAAIAWMVVGGLAYSFGCIFFLWNKLPFNHAIWHLFVLAGSACHYCMIVLHLVPTTA